MSDWLDDLVHKTVLLHFAGGEPSYRGNLVAKYDDALLLSDVVNLDEPSRVVEAGTSFFLREHIVRIQLP